MTSATRSHRPDTYLSSVERGERNLTLDTVSKIADQLGVEPLDLLQDTPPRRSGGYLGRAWSNDADASLDAVRADASLDAVRCAAPDVLEFMEPLL